MNTKNILREHIQSIGFLTDDEVEIIVEKSIVKAFSKGDFLVKQGDIQKDCFMVVRGCVREFTFTDDEKTTAFYTEGDKISSYSSGSKNIPSKHSLECLEDCILTISTDNFEEELRKLVPRLDAIIQQVAKAQLSKSKDEMTNFISSSAEERYLHLLETRPNLFSRAPSHQIASYIGVKPESLSRIRKRVYDKKNKS